MKMIIGGKHVDAANGACIDVYNPATNELIDSVPSATKEDVEGALEIARKGAAKWAEVSIDERCDIMNKAAAMLLDAKKELATILTKETGKPYADAEGEVIGAAAVFRGYAEKARHLYKEVLPNETDLQVVTYSPLGVVACIVPFNFPIDLYSHKVAPALVMGNSVIVKPSSEAPLANILMTDIIIKAGVCSEALQIITGKGSVVGKQLTASEKVNAISMTGSTEAGLDAYQNAAKHMARVSLELGGNDPMLVLDDADIDSAVENAVFGRMMDCGQVCAAAKRFIVHNSVKEVFTSKLVSKLEQLKIGDPFDPETQVGTLISKKACEKVKEQIDATIAQGAKCVYGGKQLEYAFFQPTVLTDVTAEMDIAKDMEVFGPVFPIIGFDTDEQAIEIANQTMYGLSSGIISNDIKRATKMAGKIDAGTVVVGGSGAYRTAELPWPGHKFSGIGGEGISITLLEMVNKKNLVLRDILK